MANSSGTLHLESNCLMKALETMKCVTACVSAGKHRTLTMQMILSIAQTGKVRQKALSDLGILSSVHYEV